MPWKARAIRKRAGHEPVVIGATIALVVDPQEWLGFRAPQHGGCLCQSLTQQPLVNFVRDVYKRQHEKRYLGIPDLKAPGAGTGAMRISAWSSTRRNRQAVFSTERAIEPEMWRRNSRSGCFTCTDPSSRRLQLLARPKLQGTSIARALRNSAGQAPLNSRFGGREVISPTPRLRTPNSAADRAPTVCPGPLAETTRSTSLATTGSMFEASEHVSTPIPQHGRCASNSR